MIVLFLEESRAYQGTTNYKTIEKGIPNGKNQGCIPFHYPEPISPSVPYICQQNGTESYIYFNIQDSTSTSRSVPFQLLESRYRSVSFRILESRFRSVPVTGILVPFGSVLDTGISAPQNSIPLIRISIPYRSVPVPGISILSRSVPKSDSVGRILVFQSTQATYLEDLFKKG